MGCDLCRWGWKAGYLSTGVLVQHGASPPTPRLDGRTRHSQACHVILDCTWQVSWVPGARWRWVSLVLRDLPMPSRKPGYRGPVSLMADTLGSAPWIPCPLLGLRGGWGAGSPNIFLPLWIPPPLKTDTVD